MKECEKPTRRTSRKENDGTEYGKCYFKETRTESLCGDIEGAQAQSLSVADPSLPKWSGGCV